MDDPAAARLPDVLRISGADAEKFLQAQLTCDVSSIVAGHGLPFAWCTPKGRVRHSGWLLHTGDGYTLLTSPGRAAALAEALQRFVFRDRVVMTHREPGLAIEYPANGAAVENEGTDCFELGGPHRRIRLVEGQPRRQDAAAFALAGIAAGVWELTGEFEEAYLPQMLNLDLVGGVSFRKGCYPGQEVIARTHNLGRVTRRMLRLGGEGPPPGAGTAVLAGQTRAGEILASAPENHGAVMLAVIRLDALGGEPLALAHGPRLELLPLPYPVPELDEGP